MKAKFDELSQLVLVDVLAALPMEHVVRVVHLGHERLRQTCSLKWVTKGVTNVTFDAVVRAQKAGIEVAETFCSNSIMKRLMGKIMISSTHTDNQSYRKAFQEISSQVPGRLLLCIKIDPSNEGTNFIQELNNSTYCGYSLKRNAEAVNALTGPPGLFEYRHRLDTEGHFVRYRPELLNGRHIVDVLRAVCGPADVSKAELDRVKKEATEKAVLGNWEGVEIEGWEGVWRTKWRGGAITAEL